MRAAVMKMLSTAKNTTQITYHFGFT